MERVITALRRLRIGKIIEEYDLQAKIADALLAAGIEFEKEHVLGAGSRVDFFTTDGIAIEVKKGKPNRSRLMDQIERYAAFDEVRSIVIIVETSLRIPTARTLNGKPCEVLGLQKLWGIAL
jgi:hypothetical protein